MGQPQATGGSLNDTARSETAYQKEGVREVLAMDLDTETVAVYHGDGANSILVRTLTAEDILTSDAMPGITVDLGRIFERGRREIMEVFNTAP